MTALWWVGLTLATLGAFAGGQHDRAGRRMAATGVALLVLNAVHLWAGGRTSFP